MYDCVYAQKEKRKQEVKQRIPDLKGTETEAAKRITTTPVTKLTRYKLNHRFITKRFIILWLVTQEI